MHYFHSLRFTKEAAWLLSVSTILTQCKTYNESTLTMTKATEVARLHAHNACA
jgi:hypothetical protein